MTGEGDAYRVLREQAEAWLDADPDPETRRELQGLLDSGDDHTLGQLFEGHLAFGTAGLRGRMGPGPTRMNRVVVRRATAGLMAHLPPGASVVIGHDARINSDVFARDTARVVAAAGGRALLLPCHAPTPLVAFAVRHLGTDAGVVCTASHNPPGDNGYKVYLADGAQVVPPVDEQIAAAIDRAESDPGLTDPGLTDPGLTDEGDPRIERLDSTIEQAYVEHVSRLAPSGTTGESVMGVRIVYSPLHGVGARLTRAVFEHCGYALHIVEAQSEPDGLFPTVARPNPEDSDAVRLAREEAERVDADIALIHDPDADRLGVMTPLAGEWRALSGNQIGLLLADHILTNTTGDDRLVVDTLVSSSALARLAAEHGVHHVRTLTGFKWIVRPGIDHPARRFVFGYEEALGFSVDPYVRDKDGISAALVFVDLVRSLRSAGQTLGDRLEALASRLGLFATASWSLSATDARQTNAAMARLRAAPPSTMGAFAVERTDDFIDGRELPPTDLLEFSLQPDVRVAIRPSGTEAKLKVYAEVVVEREAVTSYDDAVRHADDELRRVRDAVVPMLETLMHD